MLIHELARTLPEARRFSFLEKLNSVSEMNETMDEIDEHFTAEIQDAVREIMGILTDCDYRCHE